MIYILKTVLDKQKASKNSFQVTTFKVEENSRTFQGLAQKLRIFEGKMEFKDFQGLSLKFKDFSRLCEPCNNHALCYSGLGYGYRFINKRMIALKKPV